MYSKTQGKTKTNKTKAAVKEALAQARYSGRETNTWKHKVRETHMSRD